MDYTKGPWKFGLHNNPKMGYVDLGDDTGYVVCCLKDDARLISAAPDMYEALKEFENQLPELWGDGVRNGKVTLTLDADVIDGIMDAIRKAEGRTD